ncbi:MAG: hypothetical protein JWN17_1862 [Frankiales bacterium]|nr:hypothetical protein [Frankiales bacterium]
MSVQAGPSRTTALALLAVAVVLACVAVGTDTAGALLLAPVAAVALGLGLRDLLLVPVLHADPDGIRVVQGVARRSARWDEVVRMRTVTDRRTVLLEVELDDDEVLLLSRGRLGRDPRDVLEELQAVRP